MKWIFFLVTLLLIFIKSAAYAATATATIAVTATVSSFCTIATLPLGFGTYTGAALAQTTTVTAICTPSTPYNIGLDQGTGSGATVAVRVMTGVPSGTLSYSLYQNSAHTTVWGNTIGTNTVTGTGNGSAQAITVYGLIPAASLPAIGAYADTVTATLTY